jgi:hypothetical protein
MPVEWSDSELRASVAAYRAMQRAQSAGEKINKTGVYRQLSKEFGRTIKAFDYRMQNISAVLQEMGQEWLPGLKPASNVGPTVHAKLLAMMAKPKSDGTDYESKLPAMRARLIGIARAGARITYGELMREFNLNRFVLRHAMARLGRQAQEMGEPIITALIVNSNTGRCSPGLKKEFGVVDDDIERNRLYAVWKGGAPSHRIATKTKDEPLKARAKKFANVEVRPDQRAFREMVYIAYDGRCAISGCRVRSVLDAAHVTGRSWRDGYNRAVDGILLRKDLHALYDAKLLRISKKGIVEIEAGASSDYQEYAGTLARRPARRPA